MATNNFIDVTYELSLQLLSMSTLIPFQSTLGLAFSIAGLALVAPVSYFFRSYSHTLDAVQLFYLFATIYAPTLGLFSSKLGVGWLEFMPSFLTFCQTGDYFCSYGNLVSVGICWVAGALFMAILFKLIAIKRPNLRYQPFYTFYKGFLRWPLAPLMYFSINIVIPGLESRKYSNNFVGAAVVILFCALVGLIELIGFKCNQTEGENIWKKWIELFNHIRICSFVILVSIGQLLNGSAKYCLYAPIIIYDLIYLFKYSFSFKIFERVMYILSQSIIITIYTLFLFEKSYISTYNLDFFGLALIILLEILMLLAKIVSNCKTPGQDKSDVNPELPEEKSGRKSQKEKEKQKQKVKRNNSFIADANLSGDLSYDDLSSPRKALNRRR